MLEFGNACKKDTTSERYPQKKNNSLKHARTGSLPVEQVRDCAQCEADCAAYLSSPMRTLEINTGRCLECSGVGIRAQTLGKTNLRGSRVTT